MQSTDSIQVLNEHYGEPGYLYVYTNNESQNIDVFFDNLQVTHVRGPIVEETHYYPFGLVQQGISSQALGFGQPENKKKYNGIEKEDDLEINIYDAEFRELDAQTARWWQIDPVTDGYENLSPYASMYDNPLTYSDPLGDEGESCCWEEIKQAWGNVTGSAVGTFDNITGTHLRTTVSAWISDKSIAQGWNQGLNQADLASAVGGQYESAAGAGMMTTSATVTGGTGGLSIEITGPTFVTGAGMAVHGQFVSANGTKNLISQSGRINVQQDQTSSSGKGTQNPKVKEAVDKGNAAHKDFSQKAKDKGWTVTPTLKDPKTGKTVKPDAVTPSGKPVELKPNTASGKAKGAQQLPKYERATGQKGRVVTYDPNKY
jgi:RHS repeat-associated protein